MLTTQIIEVFYQNNKFLKQSGKNISQKKKNNYEQIPHNFVKIKTKQAHYIYVICWLGGQYSEKLWPRSRKCCPRLQAEGSISSPYPSSQMKK